MVLVEKRQSTSDVSLKLNQKLVEICFRVNQWEFVIIMRGEKPARTVILMDAESASYRGQVGRFCIFFLESS